MKTVRAERIRAMRARMEKVATGRVASANHRVQEIEARAEAIRSEMAEVHADAYASGEKSADVLFAAASTLEKGRMRVATLTAQRDEAANALLELESELYDARRATEMADKLWKRLRDADDARREKNEREATDDAGARIARQK